MGAGLGDELARRGALVGVAHLSHVVGVEPALGEHVEEVLGFEDEVMKLDEVDDLEAMFT